MNEFFQYHLKVYSSIFPHPSDLVQHLFAVLGNGILLNEYDFIQYSKNTDIAFVFPEPKALTNIYPWCSLEEFQPFRKYINCKNNGILDALTYFIDCLKLTPDTVENASTWKENIHIIEKAFEQHLT